MLLQDCVFILQRLDQVNIYHIYHGANSCAHLLRGGFCVQGTSEKERENIYHVILLLGVS